MDEQERLDFIKLYIETELKPVDGLKCVFVTPRTFDTICDRIEKVNVDKLKFYYPQGMMPIESDGQGQGGLVAGFCLEYINEQTRLLDDLILVQHLLYWITRMKLRFIKQVGLMEKTDDKMPNENLVEEMVEAEILATWVAPPDWDGQTPTWE